MQRFCKVAAGATAVLLISTGGALAQRPARHATTHPAAGSQMSRINGQPNLNGIWEVLNTANWNLEPHEAGEAPVDARELGAIGAIPPGLGVVDGPIPYKPEALKQRNENRKGAPMKDPEAACYLPGIPRANYMDHPFQIVQSGAGDILVAYEYAAANRVIHMQKVEVPPIDTWMGTSYGEWDGDTLKVVTLGQNGMTWLDRSGNYLSENASVTERFTLMDKDHMRYEATIDDPSIYTHPWKISMILYRRMEPNAEILDFRCVPFADLLVYGDLLQKPPAK